MRNKNVEQGASQNTTILLKMRESARARARARESARERCSIHHEDLSRKKQKKAINYENFIYIYFFWGGREREMRIRANKRARGLHKSDGIDVHTANAL